MEITLKSAETLFAGTVPVVVPAGTVVEFPGADNFDQLAGELAAKPALYAQFRDDLAHRETVTRHVDGEEDVKVEIVVEYGAGGMRFETAVADFEARQAEAERAKTITAENEAAQAAEADAPAVTEPVVETPAAEVPAV